MHGNDYGSLRQKAEHNMDASRVNQLVDTKFSDREILPRGIDFNNRRVYLFFRQKSILQLFISYIAVVLNK